MNNKRAIVSVWFWMLLGIMVRDSSLAQTKKPEITWLTPKRQKWMPEIPDFTRGGKTSSKRSSPCSMKRAIGLIRMGGTRKTSRI